MSTSAPDVIHSSEKSVPLDNWISLSFKNIFKFASKLEPISLDALFSSILLLHLSLIFISSVHLLFKSGLFHFDGIDGNFSRWILPFSLIFKSEWISSVVNDNTGANHFNNISRTIFKNSIVEILFYSLEKRNIRHLF